MEERVTVRDVMNRSYVGVSEADSVAGAAELMREETVHSAVVLRGSDPVGLVDVDRLLDLIADCRDAEEVTTSEVMRPVVAVDADEPLERAIAAMTTDGIRHLLVEDDGELVGSVSEHDIVTAHSVLSPPAEPKVTVGLPETEAEPDAPDLDAADLDREVYSTQGVCENCGSLARELSEHNGLLVCSDCLAF